ncbi:MAG TPA: thioredoxin family protein [Thermoguttaceae bacterium]|nr:thioredoxin family protein [Thermoguttaceae bacterium]
MTLTLAVLLHTSILAAGTDGYAQAHREAEQGKPLVVLVSTEWCTPCQTMKKTVIPEVRKRGLLAKVAFAIVDPDRDQGLAERLTGGNPVVPQLIMYRKAPDGWKRTVLIGGQSVEGVEEFIKQGVARNEAVENAIVAVRHE